jgi:hypothetical protein
MPGHDYGCPIYPGLAMLACPPYESALVNQDFNSATNDTFEGGPATDGWKLEGGSVKGKRGTDGGWKGANYYRLFPASGSAATVSLLYQFTEGAFAATYGKLKPGVDYHFVVMARCPSGGSGVFRLRGDFFDTTAGAQGAFTTDFTMAGTGVHSLPIDNTWRLYRSDSFRLTRAQCAVITYAKLYAQVVPTGTFSSLVELQMDWASMGVILDSNYLGRQVATDPFEVDKEAAWDDSFVPSGAGFRLTFHPDVQVGKFAVVGVQPDGEMEVKNFLRGAGDGAPMSVIFDLTNLSRDYYPAAVLTSDEDGIEPGMGAYSDMSFDFRTTP